MTRDLTTGSPMRLIWSFALPTLFGMLFQQFYNMMDTMIVGQLLGASALASVGSTSSINFFVIGFCMGVCNGFAIPVAQRMGAGDYSQMRRCVANAGWQNRSGRFWQLSEPRPKCPLCTASRQRWHCGRS